MQEEKFYLPDQQNHFITSYALDKLLKKADGNACLTYLYFLKQKGKVVIANAMEQLGLTEQEMYAAMSELSKLGLISGKDLHKKNGETPKQEILDKPEETPQYSAAEVKSEVEKDKVFASLLKEVEQILGKVLTAPDMNILMSMYRHLGMPSEVIYQLVCHLTAEHKERYGEGRRPTMRGIEKIAYIWVRDGILTLDAAMAYIEKRQAFQSKVGQVKKIMNLRQDSLSPGQENYIQTWFTMGFDIEVIGKAYDKTLIQAGELKWAYMHAILKAWNEKAYHTLEAVEKQDGTGKKPNYQKGKPVEKAAPDVEEVKRRRKLMLKMEGDKQ